ncbi:hypothetical protein GLOIN_2v1879550 [Rhizophagus clarus]|uniref:Uncharacterized protein n=1 Tax=Rhizophagus clarus TaxID=94130 RepID=A0A8H3LIX4_9GLOM|nr:hypothetical protein GLOIN_2v1879550 [Rhizophagus clarus]
MHHLDLGLFLEEVDRRLAAIPRFPGIKIFSNGLQSIARLTASEYRSLMKVMIFVIDNLYDENNNEVDNFVNNDDLTKLYEYWNEMYILSRYEEFSESDLEKFNDAIHRWARMFVKAFKFVSPSNLKLPKLHSWKLTKLLRTIKRQAISIRMSQHSVNPAKTPRTCKFSARLFEFSLQDANTFFNEKKDSIYLMVSQLLYDKGLCYGQALLLAEVLTDPPLNLALIQCYRVYTWCRSHSTPDLINKMNIS